jgi:hypothetical protein
MRYITEKLQSLSLEERTAETDRFLQSFRWDNPRGGWAPYDDWPSIEKVEDTIVERRQFYEEIEALDPNSELLRVVMSEFDAEAQQMRKLVAMKEEDRMRLSAHEFFPLFGRFDYLLHQCYRECASVRLNDITFTTELLGRGGFADIYKAVHNDGTPYALKLFHVPEQVQRFARVTGEFNRAKHAVLQNIAENFSFFSQRPFLAPVFVTKDYSNHNFYVMEYSPGQSVQSLMEKGKLAPEDEGRALLTYARLLDLLHTNDRCSVDNNWGAVLLERDDVRICDYDAATPREFLQRRVDDRKFGVSIYKSREHTIRGLPICPAGDLESLALMADHLVIGSAFINPEDYVGNAQSRDKNLREYPMERVKQLPAHLGQVVPELIRYPRNDSLSAQDFVSAIKADYGL